MIISFCFCFKLLIAKYTLSNRSVSLFDHAKLTPVESFLENFAGICNCDK